MSSGSSDSSVRFPNNFDLIRLLAALQVMLKHALVYLGFEGSKTDLLDIVPGVPIFFFISGYLIFQSYSNSKGLYQFAVNRLLRIYPALVVCFIVSIALVLSSGYLQLGAVFSMKFLVWAVAQLSILQIYNPEFLRGFGVGALNGSLWTVAVELQFYLLTPLLAMAASRRQWVWAVVLSLGVSANLVLLVWNQGFAAKLFSVSFPPWLYMFLMGSWLSTRVDYQTRLLNLHPLLLLGGYVVVGLLGHQLGLRVTGNGINPLSYLLLAMLIFRCAYVRADLSERLLGRNDISYGVYIYHMPVINLMVFHGLNTSAWGVIAAGGATLAFALISWRWVERPALRLKKLALRGY